MKSQDDKCPKTAMQSDALKNHQVIVILATALWLERIYKKSVDYTHVDNSHNLNQKPVEIYDFDSRQHLEMNQAYR